MEYRSLYALGKEKLAAAGIPEADLDARLLLEYVCHTSRNDLLVHGDREVAETEQQAYEQLLAKRAEHIPLQQLTGEQEFMGLTFSVNEHVLIPRQDTEVLVEEVMKNLHDGFRILDQMCIRDRRKGGWLLKQPRLGARMCQGTFLFMTIECSQSVHSIV